MSKRSSGKSLATLLGTAKRAEQVAAVEELLNQAEQGPMAVVILAGDGRITWDVIGNATPAMVLQALEWAQRDIIARIERMRIEQQQDPTGIQPDAPVGPDTETGDGGLRAVVEAEPS